MSQHRLLPSTLHRRNLKTASSLRKRIKCFPFTLRRRNLKRNSHRRQKCLNAPLRVRVNHMIQARRHCFRKAPYSKCFSPTLRCKAWVFKLFRGLKSVFEKLCFRSGLVWRVRPYRRNKAVFSNFSGVLQTRPWKRPDEHDGFFWFSSVTLFVNSGWRHQGRGQFVQEIKI